MRLAIIDDNTTLLQSLAAILGGEKDIAVVGAFRSAEDALKKMDRIAPEVVLVDTGLPGMSGIEFIRQAKARFPKIEMLVHSTADDLKTVTSAFHAGATGYLIKGSKPRALVEAIMELYNGGAPMSPKIARMMISAFHHKISGDGDVLSHREKEILSGMDKGMTYREIAETLLVSPHTVRTHIRNIYGKLPATCKSEALRKAKQSGML